MTTTSPKTALPQALIPVLNKSMNIPVSGLILISELADELTELVAYTDTTRECLSWLKEKAALDCLPATADKERIKFLGYLHKVIQGYGIVASNSSRYSSTLNADFMSMYLQALENGMKLTFLSEGSNESRQCITDLTNLAKKLGVKLSLEQSKLKILTPTMCSTYWELPTCVE